MRVQVLEPVIVNGQRRESGEVLDLPAELGNPIVASGRGARMPDEAPAAEPAAEAPAAEAPAADPAAEE